MAGEDFSKSHDYDLGAKVFLPSKLAKTRNVANMQRPVGGSLTAWFLHRGKPKQVPVSLI
jgi:hypothetical protein